MTGKKAFLIHGLEGSPQENWFPWLEEKLEEKGYRVFIPDFPTPEGQTLENWLEVFEEYEDQAGTDSIFVGHSLGCSFILNLLQQGIEAEAVFLVAGFVGPLGLDIDEVNEDIADRDFSWKEIRENCEDFYLFQSDNDPYVPMEKAKELEQKLDAELSVFEGYGHFNQSAGFTELPVLLELIEENAL